MKKSFIYGIITLLTLSLAGIIILQGLWINTAWKTKEEDFYRRVNDALNNVVQRMEKREAVSLISKSYAFPVGDQYLYHEQGSIQFSSSGFNDSLIFFKDHFHPFNLNPKPNSNNKVIGIVTMSDTNGIRYALNDSNRVMVGEVSLDSINNGIYKKRMDMKAHQLNDIITQMVSDWSNVQLPIERRVSPNELYQLIRQELSKRGIDLPFQYAVVSGKQDSICNIKSPSFEARMVKASFRADLYPNDIFINPYQLLLHFNDMRPYFIKSLLWMLLLSVVFLIMIIATFSSAIYIILKQKKVSEIKTDFINNMTHEFKTPLATIGVALDAINNPKVLDDKDRIRYYSGIISNENKRMNAHVEHILRMALVDKENFELNEQLLDVHDIIRHVSDQVHVQIEQRGGKLNLQLSAENSYVVADEIHLTNVIYNLIDNAIKYSTQEPEITVSTQNSEQGILVNVEDKGIGMSAETQRKIFEKFYRDQNGNIHNVKGFGLGLAYVKTIVKKHGGNIKVVSEIARGSRFEVFLPFGHQQGLYSAVEANPKL